MPRGKAPGSDGIIVELLQACGPTLYAALARRFSRYLAKKLGKLPSYHATASVIKGRCLLTRIRRTLDEAQPVEQAGFRRKFSTLDHIITCCRLIEAAREYQEPLVLTFVDYKKAFDSVEPAKVWKALEEQGVESRYIKVLREGYSGCTTVFWPFLNDIEVRYL
ncbi:hypothetical protein ANCCAN_24221 [Ancylostoma caninum]|uniref:Uncharacterized protein n=1 Tax=Ancylostoma caninum TaxID=29170 RepID=A0A368FG94_ANCCA|nr:hypothetical protein ANCCAN_24221 [Ancylostoma caninum]